MPLFPIRNYNHLLRAGGLIFRQRRILGLHGINKTGSALAVNKLVAISGYDTTSKLPKLVLADADSADLSTDVFVTKTAIANNASGVVYKGFMSSADLNTNSITTVGDPVYLDTTAGGFTVTAPSTQNSKVQVVGYVQVKSATVGQIAWDIKPPSKLSPTLDLTQGAGFATITGDGAIPLVSGVTLLTKGSAAAITLAAPGASGIGLRITVTTGSNFAHVVTFTGTTLNDGTAGANTTWTAAAVKGSSITVVGTTAAEWNVESFNLGTIAP